MPTFHTLEEALKYFEESDMSARIASTEQFCQIHGFSPYTGMIIPDLLSLVWQSAQEARNRELVEALKEMPLALPQLESDEYDAGLKDARENALRIVSLINK